jgi:hypothetical protein
MIKLDSVCDKMISEMQKNHTSMQITDLEQASKTKSAAEVSKMFVDSASFILRANVDKKGKSGRKSAKVGDPLWDTK